jgi:hypothetical protein
MEPYEHVPVLFWLGYVSEDGDLTYQLRFEKEVEDVPPLKFACAITNAGNLCYPIICMN